MFDCDETVYVGYTDAELSEAATYFARLELAREWRAENARLQAARRASERRIERLAVMLASVVREASASLEHAPFSLVRRVVNTVGVEIAYHRPNEVQVCDSLIANDQDFARKVG
jgi:hypothetical protein